MHRKHCQDYTKEAEAIKAKEAARKAEVKEAVWSVIGVIGFFLLYALVGTIEQWPMN